MSELDKLAQYQREMGLDASSQYDSEIDRINAWAKRLGGQVNMYDSKHGYTVLTFSPTQGDKL